MPVTPDRIAEHILTTLPDVINVDAWGEQSFFYNPQQRLPRGVYFATIKSKDGENDSASNLNRKDVFRLNIGIGPLLYTELFGARPARPAKGKTVATGHDFGALDEWMPHPVYAWMGWTCILNPSERSFEDAASHIAAAHRIAVSKFDKRIAKDG
ncbi:DUF6194 family protein [Gammaproteobacteria bacterium]|nr:DUF6194 family protein [Gammaproteobacteria bacterium]